MDTEISTYKKFLQKQKEDIPFWEKKVLTVQEAAAYTGIGITKIRQLIMRENLPFTVTNGVQVCIIKDQFVKYLDKQYRI